MRSLGLLNRFRDQRLRFPRFQFLLRHRAGIRDNCEFLFHREQCLFSFTQFLEFTKRWQLGDVLQAEMLEEEFRGPIHDRTPRHFFAPDNADKFPFE